MTLAFALATGRMKMQSERRLCALCVQALDRSHRVINHTRHNKMHSTPQESQFEHFLLTSYLCYHVATTVRSTWNNRNLLPTHTA